MMYKTTQASKTGPVPVAFPSNAKGPVSHLHKGQALFETGKREAGISELRALILRFPNSPEAAQARSKLNGMGVPIAPRRPAQ